MARALGILAYGSLISNPDVEIRAATTETIKDVLTPFKVEFARSSNGRSGAPTLVPVENGGDHVKAWIFVVNVVEQEARDRLYRREINQVGYKARAYKEPKEIGSNTVLIKRWESLGGVDAVLYTHIAPTMQNPTASVLAELAIKSAKERADGRDGISYLIAARDNGIRTPLSGEYEAEILRITNCQSLGDALVAAQAMN